MFLQAQGAVFMEGRRLLQKGVFMQHPSRRLLTRDPRDTTHSLGSLEIPTAPCRVERISSITCTYFYLHGFMFM